MAASGSVSAPAVPTQAFETSDTSTSEQRTTSLLDPFSTLVASSVLLLLYVVPMWILAFELWRTGGQDASAFFPWVHSFAANSGSALTEVHQLLLPLVSGLSVVALKSGGRGVRFLAGFVLLNFVLAIVIDVALNVDVVKSGLEGFDVDTDALAALLRRIRETLLLYYAILVGVRLGTSNPSPAPR
jgi:hypothetical protein